MTTTRLDDAAPPALAGGGVIAQGFANFYVITTRPDLETVRRVNRMKGRPPTQVGSITSTPGRIALAYDWSRLPAEFGAEPGFALLEHTDEEAARRAYPLNAAMSVTILAFHKLGEPDRRGRPCLTVECHGSLGVGHLRTILAEHGFGLVLGPHARQRLLQRRYDEAGAA